MAIRVQGVWSYRSQVMLNIICESLGLVFIGRPFLAIVEARQSISDLVFDVFFRPEEDDDEEDIIDRLALLETFDVWFVLGSNLVCLVTCFMFNGLVPFIVGHHWWSL